MASRALHQIPPTKPRSPHLNGKVERGHKTDLQEFYATEDFSASNLQDRLDTVEALLQLELISKSW